MADKLGEDPRAEAAPNMVYLVLADTVRFLPKYLEKKELINRLFRFVRVYHEQLRRVIYDPRFIEDKSLLTPINGDFVAEVVEATLEHYEQGEIASGDRVLHRSPSTATAARWLFLMSMTTTVTRFISRTGRPVLAAAARLPSTRSRR
ncbi:MAG: hypothetical protein VW268_00145 [Rhodospirillaceae bacterium]